MVSAAAARPVGVGAIQADLVAGEKRRLWVPAELAYAGKPGRPQGMLVFDVELLKILTPPGK